MMKKNWFQTLLLCAVLPLSASNEHLREYPFMRQGKLNGKTENAAAIPFDKTLYKNTNSDYSNIRLVDKNGHTIPFAVRNSAETSILTDYIKSEGKITGFSTDREKNTATVQFELDQPEEISRLEFSTSSKNFNKTVSLEFYGQDGKKIRENQDLPLYQYGKIFGSANVDFPPVKASSIRAVIHNFAERKEMEYNKETSGNSGTTVEKNIRNEEYHLKGVTAYKAEQKQIHKKDKIIPVELPEISRTNKGNLTEIIVDAHRVPCTGVTIEADDSHYRRHTVISAGDGKKEVHLAEAALTPENSMIPLPEYRGKYYIIRILNADNDPLKNIRLSWDAKEKTLVFVPPAEGDVSLYYGGNAKKQLYDIETYADKFGLPPQVYELGKETESPDYSPELPVDQIFKYLMWLILAIAAVILFISIVRMLNKSQDLEVQGSPEKQQK